MNKSQAAFQFSAERLAENGLYLWTFTFREVLDIKDTRKRWNHLLTLMKREWPELCGLRVFEMHKTHGLHVHLLTNRYIRVERARELAIKAGWGRVHVCNAKPGAAAYLAKYLSKEREPCLKRWRLWSAFGAWSNAKVKDVELQSPKSALWRACSEKLGWKGRKGFHKKAQIVADLYLFTFQINAVSCDLVHEKANDPCRSAPRSDKS
ncbi:MAG: hypothetical protein SFU53_06715 [Terrimicrobiaceae bacterium]|nr:hypothetical protein [Terrimicrobiaceae bacterium]